MSQVWLNIPLVIKIGLSEAAASIIDCNSITHCVHVVLERLGVMRSVAIEFTGKGCLQLSIATRMKMVKAIFDCNGIVCLFPADKKTKQYLQTQLENLKQLLASTNNSVDSFQNFLSQQMMECTRQAYDTDEDDKGNTVCAVWIDKSRNDVEECSLLWKDTSLCIYNTKDFASIVSPQHVFHRNEFLPSTIGGFVVFCPSNAIDASVILPKCDSRCNSHWMTAFDPNFEQKLIPCTQPVILVVGFDFGKSGWNLCDFPKYLLSVGIQIVIGGSFDYALHRHAVNQGILLIESPALVNSLQHCVWNAEEQSLSLHSNLSSTTRVCLHWKEALPTKCQIELQLDHWKLRFPVHHGSWKDQELCVEPLPTQIQQKCILSRQSHTTSEYFER